MAGHEQKPVARTNVTKIQYDLFVKECQRVVRAPNGLTLDHFNGLDRKLTLNGNGWHENIKAEVVLDRQCIEVSTMIKCVSCWTGEQGHA